LLRAQWLWLRETVACESLFLELHAVNHLPRGECAGAPAALWQRGRAGTRMFEDAAATFLQLCCGLRCEMCGEQCSHRVGRVSVHPVTGSGARAPYIPSRAFFLSLAQLPVVRPLPGFRILAQYPSLAFPPSALRSLSLASRPRSAGVPLSFHASFRAWSRHPLHPEAQQFKLRAEWGSHTSRHQCALWNRQPPTRARGLRPDQGAHVGSALQAPWRAHVASAKVHVCFKRQGAQAPGHMLQAPAHVIRWISTLDFSIQQYALWAAFFSHQAGNMSNYIRWSFHASLHRIF